MKDTTHLKFAVIATDIALFSFINKQLHTRLIPCKNEIDFPNMKCLPGGLIYVEENSDQAAIRILQEKANVKKSHYYLEQFRTYSTVDRDPRGRVVAVAYLAVINEKDIDPKDRGKYVPVHPIGKLAYDHNEILKDAVHKLQELVMSTNIIFKLIPNEFTISDLKDTWETIMGKVADKRNFLKKLKLAKALKDTKKQRKDGAHRPASIFMHTQKTIVKQNFF